MNLNVLQYVRLTHVSLIRTIQRNKTSISP